MTEGIIPEWIDSPARRRATGEPDTLEETRKLPPPVTLRDVTGILWRRAPIGLFTFVLVVATAVFITSHMAPVYEGHARILLYRNADASVPSNIIDFMMARSGNGLETEM